MGLLGSTRTFYLPSPDLAAAAEDVMRHFKEQDYDVAGEETLDRGWHISVKKGNIFQALGGLSTALKIDLQQDGSAVTAKTSVGMFGTQALPTAITVLVYHPLVLAQVWGLVRQHRLDEEALACVERSLVKQTRTGAAGGARSAADGRGRATVHEVRRRCCTNCGATLDQALRFCPECGTSVGVEPS
ncbi:MAG: zinc ribbon domain-containing protein [Chloroflexi bacterium]|nr:zinc ribbon domain-containing protein [Chloroflexota bacterium]